MLSVITIHSLSSAEAMLLQKWKRMQETILPLLRLNAEVRINEPIKMEKKKPIVIKGVNWNLQRKNGKCHDAQARVSKKLAL